MMKLSVPALLAIAALMSGCSTIAPVNPWEKGNLAKPSMTFGDNPLETRFTEHVYSSKENSSGGSGVGGGGCGCN
jgi:hypothetical protein